MGKHGTDIMGLAIEHCEKFLETASWEDIMEKYAFTVNTFNRYNDQSIEYYNHKTQPPKDVTDNASYYETYAHMLGNIIAAHVLREEGYQKNNGLWILKNPLPEAPIKPKKKKLSLFK